MQVYRLELVRDYRATFALVCRNGSERVLLGIECNYGLAVLQLNAMVAFLQETLEDDVQAKTTPGNDDRDKNGEMLSYKLKHFIHGLSVSPNLWYGTFLTSLLEVILIATKPDPCVYT